MDALLRRRMMMMAGASPGPGPEPPTPTTNYLIYGSPAINGNEYVPDKSALGFIYTNKLFNPGASEWIIQTRIKINTAVAWKDIISSVNAQNGAMLYAVVCQTNTDSSNQGYGLYLSSNGTSWNVTSNSPKGAMGTGVWRTFQIVCTRSGNKYIYKMGYPEQSSWTSTISKTTQPAINNYIAFGRNMIDADFDLSYTKIWIDGSLWWEAITE